MMIVSIGLAIFLRNIFQYFFGADNHNFSEVRDPAPTVGDRSDRRLRAHLLERGHLRRWS